VRSLGVCCGSPRSRSNPAAEKAGLFCLASIPCDYFQACDFLTPIFVSVLSLR
jgi:hypothetical protein